MNCSLPVLCVAALLTFQATVARAAAGDDQAPAVQVYLGILQLDNQRSDWAELSDTGVAIDFTDLPVAGIEAEYVFQKGWVHWGLNAGGSVAWKNRDTDISGSLTQAGGATVQATLDNSLLLVELHLGGYVRGRLNDKMTTYAAAGPMLMYGEHDVKDQTLEPAGSTQDNTLVVNNSDSSAYGLGYYARAGIDFEIHDQQHLGVGIRYRAAELDFDKTIGNIDIEGPQFVLTFTRGL